MAPPKTKGTKRKIESTEEDKPEETKKKAGKEKQQKPKLKAVPSISDNLADIDFSCTKKSPNDKESNFKIVSWNVNGIRAWLAKDGLSYLKAENPDILCIQETKCSLKKIPKEVKVEEYENHWLAAETEGYSGTGMYYKNKPIKVTEGIGIEKHDKEGRVITSEFEKFYLVNTYIPNSGRGLPRLDYRTKEWDVDFRNYIKELDKTKPVIWCGDLNVAHKEIDLKNWKTNQKSAGFTKEERESFTETLESGFIDSFRHLYPEVEGQYSFWPYIGNCRKINAGWRLDYFVISERFKDNLCDSSIRMTVQGSDHCPVVLNLAL